MSEPRVQLPFDAQLQEYERQADELFTALRAGAEEAAWRFKWLHPHYRGMPVTAVQPASMQLADARLVVAHEYAFATWGDLEAFIAEIATGGDAARFEAGVEAVVAGDLPALRGMIEGDPGLVHARSRRRHQATLLHYVAANGVEDSRQRTPANALDVARLLLEAGAEVDALADMYEAKCTTMSMLVSSAHPAEAGLQSALAELLLDHGAAFEGAGTNWQSALMTALLFGYAETAETLARRGAARNRLASAAGLGRLDEARAMLPEADAAERHLALALAAQLGHEGTVALLLDAGEDPDRYNPEGCHSHSTPLHQAVWSDRAGVVRLLVERGARLDIRDTLFEGTPLDWALYGGRERMAAYLRAAGAPAG